MVPILKLSLNCPKRGIRVTPLDQLRVTYPNFHSQHYIGCLVVAMISSFQGPCLSLLTRTRRCLRIIYGIRLICFCFLYSRHSFLFFVVMLDRSSPIPSFGGILNCIVSIKPLKLNHLQRGPNFSTVDCLSSYTIGATISIMKLFGNKVTRTWKQQKEKAKAPLLPWTNLK